MAEKPKLKEAEEILNSIGKKRGKHPLVFQGDSTAPPIQREELPAQNPDQVAEEDPIVDRKPLDFDKYQLPKRKKKKAVPPPANSEAAADPDEVKIVRAQPVEPVPQQQAGPPAIREYQFQDLEAEQLAVEEEVRQKDQADAVRLAEREAKRLRLEEEKRQMLVQQEAQARRQLLEDEGYRKDVFQRLGSQFEDEFSQMYEGSQERESQQKPQWLAQRPKPKATQPEPLSDAVSPLEEKPFFDIAPVAEDNPQPEPEAEEFMDKFQQEMQREEEHREADFKETLAEKFMRERERYLRELGITQQMEAEEQAKLAAAAPPVEPARRKLDYQIQPEMHVQQGEAPVVRPVTYGRDATVQPQLPVEIPVPPLPEAVEKPTEKPVKAKKTSEELLLELAAQNSQRIQRKAAPPPKPTQFHFRFAQVGETAAKEKKPGAGKPFLLDRLSTTGRIVTLAAACGVLVLALSAWTIASIQRPGNLIQPPADVPTAGEESQEPLNAYQSYIASAQTTFPDVIVRRSGITLSNLTVTNRLVVEEEAAANGTLTLSNMDVGEMIFVKSGGTDVLDLTNVKTKRLVIDNSKATVAIKTGGDTDIGVVELRTPGSLEAAGLAGDATGVRTVLVKNTGNTAALAFDLHDAALETLTTLGETVLGFAGAQVEAMIADGSFALSGDGRVQTLSAGYTVGAGAGDFIPPNPVNILIQGVEVGHFNIKSPANLNLATQVDSAASASSINLGGSGTVGSLVLNQEGENGRLAVDVSGLNIQQLTTNAEALIYSSGSSAINTLTANQSTYAMGNKVNLLKVNAAGVIYEREPDLVTVATGIALPQSKADNPNLNYRLELVGAVGQLVTDTTADTVATTCNHAREVGGFLLGNGSRDDPFVVSTPAQLAHVEQHLSSHFRQPGDIDLADDSTYSGGFPMIGGAGTRFSGVYDGGGYGVSNLRIRAEGDSAGLFAENIGVIRNLSIMSGTVTAGADAFMGSIAGFNLGTVESCSNGASLNGPTASYGGGIVGYNYGGTVRDCYNTAKIRSGGVTGGIVGMNRNGTSQARVAGCYNVGVVEGESTVGGVTGSNEDALVTNAYYLDSTAEEGVGSGSGSAIAKTSDEMSARQLAADLAAGGDGSLWQTSSDPSYAYPTLKRPVIAVDALPISLG